MRYEPTHKGVKVALKLHMPKKGLLYFARSFPEDFLLILSDHWAIDEILPGRQKEIKHLIAHPELWKPNK